MTLPAPAGSRRPGRRAILLLLAPLIFSSPLVTGATDTEDRLTELESQINELRTLLEGLGNDAATGGTASEEELERRIEILAEEIEKLRIGEAAVADRSQYGLGPAASKIYRSKKGVSIGGYGELIYDNPSSTRDDGTPSGAEPQFDFLRAVLYFGYKFNDRWLLNTEIEYEHASTAEDGSVSVEFAYIDYLARKEVNLRAGLLLLPMGFLNELHEPTVFVGTRRPDVEQRIIPTTWRENGAGVFGELGPVSYRTYVVNGLDGSGFSASGLRGGRQKGSKAKAEDLAWVGRVDYEGVRGLQVGGSYYHGNSGQNLTDQADNPVDADLPTTIYELHVEWRWRGLKARALGVRADVGDVAQLNQALGLAGSDSVGEKLSGGYLEVGYDLFASGKRKRGALTPYARWEAFNTQDEVPQGWAADPANDVNSLTLGLAYQPIDQIIFKLDYQDYDNAAATAVDRWNLAMGYVF